MDNNNYPKVSVITVTYNAGGLLPHTMDNVLAQTYANMEYIVIDGASTDGSQDIIRQRSCDRLKWISEKDGGIYDAMNKGVGMASGEWVLFMNAGDTFASNDTLERIFASPRTTDVIYGDVIKGGNVKKAPSEHKIYHRMLFCHQSSLTRRQLLEEHPFDTKHKMSADFKFFLTLGLLNSRFEYVGFPISTFNTEGVSNRKRSEGLLDNMRVVGETLSPPRCIVPLLRLAIPYLLCKLKGK